MLLCSMIAVAGERSEPPGRTTIPLFPAAGDSAWLSLSSDNPQAAADLWIRTNPQRIPRTGEPTLVQEVPATTASPSEVFPAGWDETATPAEVELAGNPSQQAEQANFEVDAEQAASETSVMPTGWFDAGPRCFQNAAAEPLFPGMRAPGPGVWYEDDELAPAQLLIPRSRSFAGRRPVWPNVFQREQVPGSTSYLEPLNPCAPVEGRARVPALNRARWDDDQPLAEVRLDISPKKGPLPEDRTPAQAERMVLVHVPGTQRDWCAHEQHWNAPQTTHAPLYFEEPNLERYGYSRGYWQPLVSGVQFFATAPLLPGLMTIDPPNSVQYELSESDPGSMTPYAPRQPEWTYKAVLVELTAVTGMAFIIP
ncbi:hypothetical protein [Rubinisphaera margarita]|uniref:hypothetical protein n=1 Tax=Rubinisphaera margarita TaxID=2909586 RepID=UPI001EE83A5F|nr:hypothetical protein [Rubinisphaera margarita]